MKKLNRYQSLIADIFEKGYSKGDVVVPFSREQLISTAAMLGIPVPKNVGDILYSFRYRNPLPERILKTQPKGKEWVIEGTGRAEYEFRLVPINRIAPNDNLINIKIPDYLDKLPCRLEA